MPRLVGSTSTSITDVSTDAIFSYPKGIQVGDVLFCVTSQDGGATVISNVDVNWIQIQTTQGAANGQRTVTWYKEVTDASESETSWVGRNETWSGCVFALRDVNLSSIINVFTRASWNASRTHNSPTVTTTVDDCMIIYVWGSDQSQAFLPNPIEDLNFIAKSNNAGQGMIAGYTQQDGQGLTDVVQMIHESTSEGGECHVFAVEPATSTGKARQLKSMDNSIVPYGNYETVAAATDPSLVLTTNIGGMPVFSQVEPFAAVSFTSPNDWARGTKCTMTASTSDQWSGGLHTLNSAIDMDGKNCSIMFSMTNFKTNRVGKDGAIMVLIDSSGNWAAIQLSDFASHTASKVEVKQFTVGVTPTFDESGTPPDYTDIDRIAWLAHRTNATSNNCVLNFRDLIVKDNIVLVGGNINDPVSPAMLQNSVDGWGYLDQSVNQGSGQGVASYGIQFGDGTIETYVDFTATAYQPKVESRLNNITELTMPVEIFASATCTMNITSCVCVTELAQEFGFNASSNTSATYNFAGANIVGWTFTGLLGVDVNGATFTDCDVTQDSGTFSLGTFVNSPMSVDDMDEIANCNFDSNSSVDLTVAGTFTLDGSTIDTLTNSSGGNITLNALNGASVINNNGPNITINNAVPVSVTVLDDSTGLPIANVARVHLLESVSKVVIMSLDTDANGIADTTFNYSSDIDIEGWARQMDIIGVDYIPADIAGVMTAQGFLLTVRLTPLD